KMFLYVGYDANYYVPNRYIDGYGLTLKKAQEIVNDSYQLVITVDNGITAFDAIKFLKEHGVKVIVLDHHTPQDELPCADYIIHPTISSFSSVTSSGGFVAFVFSKYILGYYDKYLSILASISVVSDMMPLKDQNRNLLRIVLKEYKPNEFLQIDLLKENYPFNEYAIGSKIAPKINAVGRLIKDESINDMVKFFVTTDIYEISRLYKWIDDTNELRKDKSNNVINSLIPFIDKNDSCVVMQIDAEEGLLGLVATKILKELNKPTIIFSEDINDSNLLKGSCRAKKGMDVIEVFSKLNDLIEVSGGHELAGGLTIKKSNFEQFKIRFKELCNEIQLYEEDTSYIDFGITDLTFDNYNLINSFSPFGVEWKEPKFKIKRIKTDSLTFSKDGKHIVSTLGISTRLVGFNFSSSEVLKYKYIDIFGKLKTTYFRNQTNLEFTITEIKETK
ncbi:MAG: DHHA1 domain-containing protein, partial [Bacilli bacterium]